MGKNFLIDLQGYNNKTGIFLHRYLAGLKKRCIFAVPNSRGEKVRGGGAIEGVL
jgi:hypothetical protein